MKRRGFIGAVATLIAAPVVGAAMPDRAMVDNPDTHDDGKPVRVMRADGKAFIVGVAMETVHVGDFVQIQTRGNVTANMHR